MSFFTLIFQNRLFPSKTILVKYNLDSVEPLRNAKGQCILVKQGILLELSFQMILWISNNQWWVS